MKKINKDYCSKFHYNENVEGYVEQCKNLRSNEHVCPFSVEINNDHKLCTCCPDCTHNCAMDV